MYSREAVLPINKPYDFSMRDRMMQIVKDPKKEKLFQIEEEVLYHNAAKKKYYSSKLEKKWKGSYTINAIQLMLYY